MFRVIQLIFPIFTILCFQLHQVACAIPWPPKQNTFLQQVDHFTFGVKAEQFKQIYLYEDKWWKPKGPIFFYCGNEGGIEGFWNNTGFMFDIAPKFNALIIFGEHRYYGRSLPFGDKSFTQPYISYLSIEQALADYAYMLDGLKTIFKATDSPVIAFGGSYGGMLAAYMRFKYPNMVTGAIAASAPIYWVADTGNRHEFFEIIAQDCAAVSPKCVAGVQAGYKQLMEIAKTGSKGLHDLSQLFRLCRPMTSQDDVDHLLKWSRNAWVMMAMLNYPYASDFMGKLPANPISVACQRILRSVSPLAGLRDAVAVFYNASGVPCTDLSKEYVACADITGCGLGPAAYSWDFQACTEIALFDGSPHTPKDMFPSLPLTRKQVDAYCSKKWGVTRADKQMQLIMWGQNIKTATNIVFSNGDLDPWHGGGVLKNISNSLVALVVKGGAHHLDLREANPKDPVSVKQVRNSEVAMIQSWLKQHYEKEHRREPHRHRDPLWF